MVSSKLGYCNFNKLASVTNIQKVENIACCIVYSRGEARIFDLVRPDFSESCS